MMVATPNKKMRYISAMSNCAASSVPSNDQGQQYGKFFHHMMQ